MSVQEMRNKVILVDADDNVIGHAPKLEAHRKGMQHRAFSIVVFNSNGEILLQKRASGKYHSAGLWSNTCCSHPQPGESIAASAAARLQEEMGFSCELEYVGKFGYKAHLDNQLVENEIDHVFCGSYEGSVHPDSDEVAAFQWVAPDVLLKNIEENPERYTYWLGEVIRLSLESRFAQNF